MLDGQVRIVGVFVMALLASGCTAAASESIEPASQAIAIAAGDTDALPIVLVAGLMQDGATVAPLADALREGGFDVTVWIPPGLGLEDIYDYASQLGETVEDVLRRTGATHVDLVGHSEGGVTARRYAKDYGEDAPVRTLVSLGSPQQGTEGGLLSLLLRIAGCEVWAPACQQMVAGSQFLEELNGGDATPGSLRYVTVGSRHDGVVQPVTRAGILGAENLVMQDICPDRVVGHFGLLDDAWVHQVVRAVLTGGAAAGDCGARPVGSLL